MHAQINEGMTYREGDGPDITIPPGPAQVEVTGQDVTVSWERDETRGATAIPLAIFRERVKAGLVVLPEPLPEPPSTESEVTAT
jgi:hypothetical protein